jgi:hypothetical protein
VSVQRVQANLPGLVDTTSTESFDYSNTTDFTVYGALGTDNNSNDATEGLNQNRTLSASYFGPKGSILASYVSVGENYDPVDGYEAHPDTHGFNYSGSKEIDFSSTSVIQKLNFSGYQDRYFDHFGEMDQLDEYVTASVTTRRSLYYLYIYSGSNYLLEPAHGLTPFTQVGPTLSYNPDPSLSIDAGLRSGHYYDGFLHSAYWDATLPLGNKSKTLNFNYYETSYTSPTQAQANQALFRVSTALEFSRDASFSLGWRTIVGSAPGFTVLPYARDGNLSAAFSQRLRCGNLYVVYGDPNSSSTTPALIVKLVIYALGQQGT